MLAKDNPLRWQRFFDAVFWIGLESRPDRLAYWGQNLHELTGYPVHYWRATDPWETGVMHDPTNACQCESRGHLGCYLSHYFVMRTIAQMRVNALILEDDIKLVKNFLYELDREMTELVQDWDVLHLGGYDKKRWIPPEFVSYGGYPESVKDAVPRNAKGFIPAAHYGVWAQIVRWEAADRMADEMMERRWHTDLAFDAMYAEHGIRLYNVKTPLAFHAYKQVKSHSSAEALELMKVRK